MPDRHPRLERDDVADHPCPLPAVFLVDVLDDLLAVRGREIDVDVGRAGHLLVEEALEKQVVLDGVDPRDAEHVGDDRVRGRTPALARDTMLAGKAHEVPVDEEELGQAGLLDHLELVLQAAGDGGGDRPVALAQAFEAELVEKRERRLAHGHGIAGEPDLAKVEVEVALLRDLPGGRQGFGVAFEERAQLRPALQVMLRVGEEVRPRLFEGGAVADGDEHVVQVPAGGHVVVDLVGRHHARAAPFRHPGAALEHPFVLGPKVMVQLAEDVVLAERLEELTQPLFVVCGAEVEEVSTMLGDPGQGGAGLAFGLVGVGEGEEPAQIGIAGQVARDEDQLFAVDLERAADDRPDPELAAGLEMADGAVDAAMVGDGEGGHLELGRARRELIGMRSSVEEGEVRVAVELDIRRRHQAALWSGPRARAAYQSSCGGTVVKPWSSVRTICHPPSCTIQ